MFKKRNYAKQARLGNFYDSNNPDKKKTKTSRKSRSKKIETFPSDSDLCQKNPAFASTLVHPKDGMTDFNIFSRPEPDLPSILNCGLIFKLIDIKCFITEKNDKREILHLYGVTENQSSVLVHVNDFSPSIIVGLQNIKPNQKIDLNEVQDRINLILGHEETNPQVHHKPILKLEILQKNETQSQQQHIPTQYLKFFLSHIKYVKELRKLLKSSTETYLTTTFKEIDEETETYFKLHFLKERNLSVFGWIFIEPEHIYCRPDEDRESLCQIEIDVTSDRLIPIPSAEGDNSTWPLRIVSFDLECETIPGEGFPRAERRPIIQIANTCRIIEDNKSVNFKNIFVVGSCAHIEGSTIYSYSNDAHLLRNWRSFMLTFDPDIVIGYNIVGFDFRYISKRAQKLNLEGFFTLGRLKVLRHTSVIDPFVEKLNVDGRIIMDMPGVVRAECPGLDKYGLGAVSQALLGETKCDVAYSDLYAFQHGNALTRQKIAIYCIQDTNLPMKLLDKLNILPKYAYKVREMGILLQLVPKKSRYSNKNPKFAPKADEAKGQVVAKPPFKKFNRSATQAVGEFSGLSCLENVLETISGSNIFRVYIPALYKKQNYKLSYLGIKRMFIKVYNDQNLEMLAYLIGDAYENLHATVEGIEEILVTKFLIEEPKPGRKILKITKAMAFDVNYKAVDVLRSINNITWVNGQAFLSEFKNTKDFDLSVFKNLKKPKPLPIPFSEEKPKEDLDELEYKEEWMDQVEELSQTSFNCQSNTLPAGEVQSSSQRLETGSIKRSQSHLNFEYPSQEFPLEEELDHDVRKKCKISTLDAKMQEEEKEGKMIPEAPKDSNDLYLPMSVISYPNIKWVIKCCDFSTHDESVAGARVRTTNSEKFVRDLISRDYYRLTVVKNDNENSLDLNRMVVVEEVCVISSEDFWRIQDIMKVRARTPSEFALVNTVFIDDEECYLMVHSAAWNAGTTSSSQEVNMDSFRIFKLNTGFEHLLA